MSARDAQSLRRCLLPRKNFGRRLLNPIEVIYHRSHCGVLAMRRRDFLRLGATLPAAIAGRQGFGQANTVTRAAVVIGIDRPDDLPPLHAAVSGARQVAAWLKLEGVSVELITDDQAPVKADQIFDAVDKYVNVPTLQQLIVYFAGHGSYVGTGDYWLLSRALHNSNQAVSLAQCPQYARQCGIPNVVVITDACRSTSTSLKIQSLSGSNIFPTVNNRNVPTYLDMFYAVRPGAPAYEVKDVNESAKAWKGIYTECLLEAYVNPGPNLVEDVDGMKVITNKKLELYLLSTVPQRAQIFDRNQYPDSSVTSTTAYMGHAIEEAAPTITSCSGVGNRRVCSATSGSTVGHDISSVPLTINNLAQMELSILGVRLNLSPNVRPTDIQPVELEKIDHEVGFRANRNLLLNARGPNVFPTRTGINVFGTRLRAVVSANMATQTLVKGNGLAEPTVIQIDPRGTGQESIALQFEHGSGTVIAALSGYVATVIADSEKVISVSYERASEGQLGMTPLDAPLAHLRAVVATAAKFGVFRIDGPPAVRESNAARLADTIRVEKSVDPTLGIYAAYAYAAAGLDEQIRSVHSYMLESGIELFDVALLADPRLVQLSSANSRPAPFCPMLSQGWQFLAVKNVTLSPTIAQAQSYIVPSLWTTFGGEGMSIVKSAIQFQKRT
jgi:Caspase domain